MKRHWLKFVMGMYFLSLIGLTTVVKADSINFTLKVEDDDEAHFHFRDKDRGVRERHNPMIWRAAADLRQAKRKLWVAGGPDFGGQRVRAIRKINEALAALWAADQYDIRHTDHKDMRRERREDRRDYKH